MRSNLRFYSTVSLVRNQGFSIIEMLVALAIGLIVVLVVGRLFTMNTASNHETTSLARMQENARFSMDLLGNDIRSAGDLGCSGLLEPNWNANISSATTLSSTYNLQRDPNLQTVVDDAVMAYTPASSAVAMTGLNLNSAEVATGSDVLSIKRGDTSNKTALSAAQIGSTIVIDTNNAAGFQAGDLLLIQNCVQADVFVATSVGGNAVGVPGFANGLLYAQYSEVMRYVNDIYYLGSGVGASAGQTSCPANAFCRKSLVNGAQTTEVLANNVESFNVFLGLLNNSTKDYIDTYETPNTVAAIPAGTGSWCRVGAVQVNLVFRGDDHMTSKSNTPYWLNNAQVTPATGDSRLRRGYSQVFYIFSRQKLINNKC